MQSEPQSIPFSHLLTAIEKGTLKVPQFQRQFVWSKQKSAELLDSILKAYPIGTFILWKTREALRSVRNIGGAQLPPTQDGDYTEYVLDGQQRLTSLFAAVKGLDINRDGHVDNFEQIFIDLDAHDSGNLVTLEIDATRSGDFISLLDLIGGSLLLHSRFAEKHHQRLSELKSRITSYNFSTILLKDASLDVATDIFTRINVTAKPLSVFEIMVAKTFDSERNFDLSEQYESLVERLSEVGYETVSSAAVLQSISCIISGECDKTAILKLNKQEFITVWPYAIAATEAAIDYFRSYFRIPVSTLLPYGALLVPFTYFFYKHKDKPLGELQRRLEDFFWRVSLTSRYSFSLESRLAQDVKKIDAILCNEEVFYDQPVDLNPEFILGNGVFNAGRSYIKAILCLLVHEQPKSFVDNSHISVSNDWLKQANSRNYHHFFPRAYLKRTLGDDWRANHIANITIVDDFLNKRLIRDKAPATYMNDFSDTNQNLEATMRTHLISLEDWGIWENDFDLFIKSRCSRISEELKKRIIPQQIDGLKQATTNDLVEEELV
jgi:hypothetical protein